MDYFCVSCRKKLWGNKKKYCSNTCKCRYFAKQNPDKCNLWNKRNPKPKTNNKCKTCGKECGRKKYCSDICKPRRMSIPIYWDKRGRFNLKCRCCEGIILKPHMHHINGNHEDNTPKNLIVLCPSCHQRVHVPKKRYNQQEKKEKSHKKLLSLQNLLKKERNK